MELGIFSNYTEKKFLVIFVPENAKHQLKCRHTNRLSNSNYHSNLDSNYFMMSFSLTTRQPLRIVWVKTLSYGISSEFRIHEGGFIHFLSYKNVRKDELWSVKFKKIKMIIFCRKDKLLLLSLLFKKRQYIFSSFLLK